MSRLLLLAIFAAMFLFASFGNTQAVPPERQAQFSQFSLSLPPNWDGDEQVGFISDNPAEYLLTLGHKDEAGDNFIAQVSIYLLPNTQGVDAQKAAQTLAEAQGESSEPTQAGKLWRFTGEPRARTVKGRATTWVNTDPKLMLIIIAQDPQNLGADEIVKSLKGNSPEVIRLLGR